MRYTSICVFFTTLLISCSPGDESAESHSFQMVEEDGIPVALTKGGPKYEGELFNYEYLLSLQEDEREESLLNQPYMFTTDETEHYYVADYGDSRVAVFDSEGCYSHSIGRRGEGPGEFRYPEIPYVRNGIISILDTSQRRVSRFSTDGTLLDVISTPRTAGFSLWGLYRLENGKQVEIKQESGTLGEGMEFRGTRASILSAGGDTLWSSDFGKVRSNYVAKIDMGNGEMDLPMPYPYGGIPICEYEPELGILYSNGWDPIIDVYDLDGNHTKRIHIDAEPVPTTREDLVQIQKYWDSLIEETESETSRNYMRSMRETVKLPEYRAFWNSIDIDDAGYIWLLDLTSSNVFSETDEGQSYHILSAEGEYLGTTIVPEGSYGMVQCGRFMILDSDEETGIYELKVYQIVPAVSGLKYPW